MSSNRHDVPGQTKRADMVPVAKDPGTVKKKKLSPARIVAIAFWLTVWAISAHTVGKELLLPSPLAVGRSFASLALEASFWLSALYSLMRVLFGFVSGVVVGAMLAVLTTISRIADTLLSPAIKVVRATPVASFIILVLLWVRRSAVPGFIAALMALPVVWSALVTAIAETDKNLLEMARAYDFGKMKTIRLVYVPSAMPQFLAACMTAQGLAWKSGIAAEVICLPRLSAGAEIYRAKLILDTPTLFAWTAIVIVLSLVLESLFRLIIERAGKLS